jgi:hypothetical protein
MDQHKNYRLRSDEQEYATEYYEMYSEKDMNSEEMIELDEQGEIKPQTKLTIYKNRLRNKNKQEYSGLFCDLSYMTRAEFEWAIKVMMYVIWALYIIARTLSYTLVDIDGLVGTRALLTGMMVRLSVMYMMLVEGFNLEPNIKAVMHSITWIATDSVIGTLNMLLELVSFKYGYMMKFIIRPLAIIAQSKFDAHTRAKGIVSEYFLYKYEQNEWDNKNNRTYQNSSYQF